ncbi:16S rRNA (uracil(1498)-N(3))-methyltransferase [Wukongibacter baidiensis]|uniref:16S rRNA (uracil(1498)-N(3))-methyltransferase n=1 Tax=Wukongibacter baidiensis TaxID=1723361 RepID=UPI003D7FB7B7
MNRFFVNSENILEDEQKIVIDEIEDIKHITKVLRLSVGDEIEICNKAKVDYKAAISSLNKNEVVCEILEKNLSRTEAPVEITLFQGIPKGSKMDLIIQKGVEVGVSKIVPFTSERCVVKIKDRKSEDKKIERWQKIANEAAKQCKRGIIPRIGNVVDISNLRDILSGLDMVVMPYEEEKISGIRKAITSRENVKKIGIIIGPEGGFASEEVLMAKEWGSIPVSLGPRILRTETAGLVTASIIMYELGDLGGN